MTSRKTRRVASRLAVLSAFALLALTSAQPGAAAATTSTTFGGTGAEQTFTVPSGVTSIHVVAQGGSGGEPDAAFRPPAGGAGGQVTADLAVTPGETLYIEVGANGATSSSSASFNGGGGGGCSLSEPFFGCAGAGGGATDVRTIARTAGGTLDSRLIVAGGGGGGGNFTRSLHQGGSAGYPAGQNGVTDPLDGGGQTAGGGGGGGSQSGPGGGGPTGPFTGFGCAGTGGSPGVLDTGGGGGTGTAGDTTGGGGGGGGLFGGGGGGVGCNLSGGGGGGGSDLVPDGGTATTSYAAPSVTITWANDSDLALTNVPADITASATSSAGAVVTYTPPTVVDEDSPLPAVTCDTPSGSTFPIGATTVTCTASDSDDSNSPVSASFTVTVTDSDLALTGTPADVTVNATSPAGAVVNYTPPTAVDEDSPLPTVTCDTPPGSTFAIGTTTVICTASDSDDSNSPVSTTFTVTVVGAADQLQQLAAAVVGVGPGTSLADKVQAAETYLAAGDVADADGVLNAFINEVKAQSGKKIPQAQAAQLIAAAQRIIAVIG
jgi:hypothetical protein